MTDDAVDAELIARLENLATDISRVRTATKAAGVIGTDEEITLMDAAETCMSIAVFIGGRGKYNG
ncbi:MAG: hypothetical protein AAF674_16750 [Pseudomonadota bacterium]